jgi:hypothetical protein
MPAVEPLVVPSPASTKELSPLLDTLPAIVPPPVPPPPIPPRFGIPHSLAPGRDGAELAAIIEIGGDEGGTLAGGDEGGTGGDDGGI